MARIELVPEVLDDFDRFFEHVARFDVADAPERLAAIVQEEAFEWLDAPVRVLGALDTPVPYAPPLEEYFLVSEAEIAAAAHITRPHPMDPEPAIAVRRDLVTAVRA